MSISISETVIAPTFSPRQPLGEKVIYYPESDGKPMGETDRHIHLILELLATLDTYFQRTTDVKVFADIMFYYEEGNPRKVISPDVMVVKGVGNHSRRVFKLWEENVPDVVFEISSRETWRADLQKKYTLYEKIGVKEYYVFDPEYDYLPEPLLAYHLKGNSFKQIKVKKGRVFSPSLNLEIVDTGEGLRLYNSETKSFLLTNQEFAQTNEVLTRNNEDLTQKLSQADEEIERLKAELAKLKNQK